MLSNCLLLTHIVLANCKMHSLLYGVLMHDILRMACCVPAANPYDPKYIPHSIEQLQYSNKDTDPQASGLNVCMLSKQRAKLYKFPHILMIQNLRYKSYGSLQKVQEVGQSLKPIDVRMILLCGQQCCQGRIVSRSSATALCARGPHKHSIARKGSPSADEDISHSMSCTQTQVQIITSLYLFKHSTYELRKTHLLTQSTPFAQ